MIKIVASLALMNFMRALPDLQMRSVNECKRVKQDVDRQH